MMIKNHKKVWWFIAWRYLRSKRQTQVINILTYISIAAVAGLVAAFIIIVSVFNGFDGHFKKMYNSLYPDLIIKSKDQNTFVPDTVLESNLEKLKKEIIYSQVLQDKAFVNYEGQQSIVKISGVDSNFFRVVDMQITSMDEGYKLRNAEQDYCYYSFNTSEALHLNVSLDFIPIEVQMPQNTTSKLVQDQVAVGYLYPKGVYNIEDNQGEKDMITSIEFVRNMTREHNSVSLIAIKIKDGNQSENIIRQLKSDLPQSFDVLTRYQQNESIYKIVNSERYMVYAILVFMLLLSSLNVIGVLLMTMIEKKRDMAVLRALGADLYDVQGIFLRLGTIIGIMGAGIGLVIGLGFSYGQQYFHWIKMSNTGNIIEDSFPIQVRAINIIVITFIALIISVMASYLPSRYAARQESSLRWSE